MREISHRVLVIYMGRVMEEASREDLYADARHPYTLGLLSAAPIPDPALERGRKRVRLTGEPPSPFDPASALRFLPSKKSADPKAPVYVPKLEEVGPGHRVAGVRRDLTFPNKWGRFFPYRRPATGWELDRPPSTTIAWPST